MVAGQSGTRRGGLKQLAAARWSSWSIYRGSQANKGGFLASSEYIVHVKRATKYTWFSKQEEQSISLIISLPTKQ